MYDSNNWLASLHREVGGGVRLGPPIQGRAVTLLLPCSVCHQTKEFHSKEKLPPPVHAKKLKDRGWKIGKHLVCPSCVKTRPNAVKSPQPIPQPERVTKVQDLSSLDQLFASAPVEDKTPTKTELLDSLSAIFNPAPVNLPPEKTVPLEQCNAPPPDKSPVSPRAKKALPETAGKPAPSAEPKPEELTQEQRGAVMLALEQYFKTDTGTYHRGYSDSAVAQQNKVPVEQVVALRRQWFGELQVSPELSAARSEYEAYRQELLVFVSQARSEIAARKEKLQVLRRKVLSLES